MTPDDPRHGTQNGYGNLKCRCDACREAHRVYFAGRQYTQTWRAKNYAEGRNARNRPYASDRLRLRGAR